MPPEAFPLPQLEIEQATLASRDAMLEREWLVTNGIGGFAMATLPGTLTRSYHGLLVAARRPPGARTVLVAKVDEAITLANGSRIELGMNEYEHGIFDPHGADQLAAFSLDGTIPCVTYRLDDGATLEKRIWMEHEANLSYISYTYHTLPTTPPNAAPIQLEIRPRCLDRDYHGSTRGTPDWHFLVTPRDSGCTVQATPETPPYLLLMAPSARFTATGLWYWQMYHRAEAARDLNPTEDVYEPGFFTLPLLPEACATLVLSADVALPASLAGIGGADHERVATAAFAREQARCGALLTQAGLDAYAPASGTSPRRDALATRLVLAADQFLVQRDTPAIAAPTAPGASDGQPAAASATVIAGYPWFTDWGRDSMIALPGLTLATGRVAEARALLRIFVAYMSQGMIPNRFPDDGEPPEYNTVDATLWLFHALHQYLDATHDWTLLDGVYPALAASIEWHVRGTRHGIRIDSGDGLLAAGTAGTQLTWMDAQAGDWIVTPRCGKPVEVNALWHRAVSLMAGWAQHLGRSPILYNDLAAAVEESFYRRFWYADGGYLYDVVDVDGSPGMLDWSLRPNQVMALALAPSLVPAEAARTALARVRASLLTPLGLRTLAPDDPRFHARYQGDQRSRDGAYHQGTVWPWLLGPYSNALQACGAAAEADALLATLVDTFTAHLSVAGIGSISEIADGGTPFVPRGCVAQAWSVAELLRIIRRPSGTFAEGVALPSPRTERGWG